MGVFSASPYRLFQDAVTSFPDQAEQIYLLNVPSNMMARLSYLKNWSGLAATVIDTACSSVLKAVHDACTSLRQGECSVALVGGAHTIDRRSRATRLSLLRRPPAGQ